MTINPIFNRNTNESIPAKWHYASGTVALTCLLFGFISNGSILVIFFRNATLRRPRNYFLINLAITDLGLLLTNNTMHVIASFKRSWPFGRIGCDLYAVCGGVFGLSSISTMAAIAIIRLIVVITPFNSFKLTHHFMIKCLFCIWIYGSIWILPPLFGWSRFIKEGLGTSCTFDYISKQTADRFFIFFLTTGGFLVPLTIILVSYAWILMKLVRRSQNLMRQMPDLDSISLQSNQINSFQLTVSYAEPQQREALAIFDVDGENLARKNIRRTEIRATRTSLIICAVFCFAWGPYSLMTVLAQFGFDWYVNEYSTSVLALFTKTAACVNPLVYALTSSIVRQRIYSWVHRGSRTPSKVCESSSVH